MQKLYRILFVFLVASIITLAVMKVFTGDTFDKVMYTFVIISILVPAFYMFIYKIDIGKLSNSEYITLLAIFMVHFREIKNPDFPLNIVYSSICLFSLLVIVTSVFFLKEKEDSIEKEPKTI